jgi:segregation and condensation protein B
MDEKMRIVEAILFSSEKPLRVGEIAKIAGMESSEVSKAMKKLRKEYEDREGAIEIARIGNKYVMQLKNEYVEYGYAMGKKELRDDVLKTLAIIAYYQPITQSKLRDIIGSKVYAHIDELKKRGFVYGKRAGKTIVLRTTKKFNEYFGIDASKPQDIKRFFEEKMGGEKDE